MRIFWWIMNWIRGLGFRWVETPGTPAGGYYEPKPGTCHSPVHPDGSVKGCIKRGDCGCDESEFPA